ncbi:hypothetical protein K6T82_18400 [Flavobacterium sp. 17A]|uniref:Uncharacterized protein n=1 Tax=Flavobacterium potami TaxID=2872310 RepID=A0A9X1HDP4_9FLAO|nr:hypothetical protein [Flavobacterium potami]MBZ4036748.1 hypothetical protein [Flavobacterium potami]
MNYATQHHIGNYQPARRETTAETAPTVGRVRKMDEKAKGCEPGAERQTQSSTSSNASNGILKCTFLPKLKTADSIQACQKTERDFYKSLSKLAEHYSIEPMQTKDFGFPYNVALSLWDMESKVQRTNTNWDGFKLVQDSQKTFLVSEEKYNTGTTLYYIPIVPLFRMLKAPKDKENAHLLISVCCYLYHIADIPYYRQENSYLYWMYEMHKEWVEQDDDTEDTQIYKREFKVAEDIGDRIEQRIFNRKNLVMFEQRLHQFRSRNTFDSECYKVACNALDLYTEYPKASIFRNAPTHEEDLYNDDYENETIGMEKYISFIADTKGWLYESLSDSINNEFNEYGRIDEPTITKSFGDGRIAKADLDFENRLFALLDELCTLLYNY